jgi:hypothetical protein
MYTLSIIYNDCPVYADFCYNSLHIKISEEQFRYAPVAQLDRALVFGTSCWGFESLRAYVSLIMSNCSINLANPNISYIIKMMKLTEKVLKDSIQIDDQFGDILNISDKKVLASFSHENPFSLIPDLDRDSIDEYFESKGIKYFSTPPWVADGHFLGLTIYWEVGSLQKVLDKNKDVLEKYMWPTEERAFAMKVNVTIASSTEQPELYKLIAMLILSFWKQKNNLL